MKKNLMIIFLALVLISFVSSDIIITQEPSEIYNLGDTVSVQATVVAVSSISDQFNMELICNGGKKEVFYTNGVSLTSGEQAIFDASLILTKDKIGETTGTCKIKAWLGDPAPVDYIFTKDFEISNLLTIQPNTEQTEFSPGKSILIKGTVTKENGHDSNGFIDVEIATENSTENIMQVGTISNGFYSINITLPENMKAGTYLVKLNAYEIDLNGKETNKGFSNYNIIIKQIPTSLEIAFEENPVEPGTNLKVKTILHDQTGEKISANAIITIKKGENNIQQQSEVQTDEYLEYPIEYNEIPSNWTVFAVSNQLTAEATFSIKEKKEIEVELINETVIIRNKGNIPYNDTIFITIGNQTIDVEVYIDINGEQEFKLKAPDGEYEIEILDEEGQKRLNEVVTLTGRTIDIKESNRKAFTEIIRAPIVWIFIVFIFGFVIFMIFKKGYQRSFFGKISFKKKLPSKVNTAWEKRALPLSKNSKLKTQNKATLSLSIKGSKDEVSLVTLKVRNLKDIQSKKGNAEETLQKIVDFAEDKKAFVYENQDDIFFIVSPIKTKTFKNETIALEIAQEANEILKEHNRLFKQKISFGISVEIGTIVEKLNEGNLEFMSMGTFFTNAKKIASVAQEELALSEKMRARLSGVRTEKLPTERVNAYKIKEIKYHDEDHVKFIKSFLKRTKEEKKD